MSADRGDATFGRTNALDAFIPDYVLGWLVVLAIVGREYHLMYSTCMARLPTESGGEVRRRIRRRSKVCTVQFTQNLPYQHRHRKRSWAGRNVRALSPFGSQSYGPGGIPMSLYFTSGHLCSHRSGWTCRACIRMKRKTLIESRRRNRAVHLQCTLSPAPLTSTSPLARRQSQTAVM
jgi:hypothetical protein